MMQLGEKLIDELLGPFSPARVIEPFTSIAESIKDLNNKEGGDFLVDTVLNVIGKAIKKKLPNFKCSGLTLTNNEIKDIIKVIRSLENRGIFLKGTTRKTTNQEVGFLNFLRPLMTAGLPLMKNVLMPLAKSVLVPLR